MGYCEENELHSNQTQGIPKISESLISHPVKFNNVFFILSVLNLNY